MDDDKVDALTAGFLRLCAITESLAKRVEELESLHTDDTVME